MKHMTVFIALALFLAACAPPVTPAPTSTTVPTVVPSIVPSNTLEPAPSPTAAPSRTPEPTPSLIPTLGFVFILPTATVGPSPTTAPALACQVLAQSIVNGTEFHPQESFSNDWLFANVGSAPWFPGNVDFAYTGGTRMNLSPVVQLRQNVRPGSTVSLNVDMKAPSKPSDYTTFWSLRQGNNYFCRVKLTISVVLP